jgi:hypothetical protein
MDEKQLEYLRSVDSPTIANAIEQLKLRDRCDGFVGGSIRCQFPELGVMLGSALTVTMDSRRGGRRVPRRVLAHVGRTRAARSTDCDGDQ